MEHRGRGTTVALKGVWLLFLVYDLFKKQRTWVPVSSMETTAIHGILSHHYL